MDCASEPDQENRARGVHANGAKRSAARITGVVLGVVAVAGSVLLGAPSTANAVPGFARKYGTSCQTCHTVFPRLTPFGEAFRANGHRFPEGDEEKVKEPPVSLGSEAYKKMFPFSVWPSEIPSFPAFSVVPKMRAAVYDTTVEPRNNLAGLNPMFDVYLAESLGSVGVFGKFQVNGPACTNCHSFLAVEFRDVIPDATIRVGRFQPEYFSFHQQAFHEFHEVLGPFRTVGNNAWNFGKDVGAEIAGTLGGRFRYVFGVNEGLDILNLPHASKGVYGRVAVKLGGLRWDGKTQPGYEPSPKNWRERAITVGSTLYAGFARIKSNDATGSEVQVDDRYWVAATDANAVFDDVTVFGGAVVEWHAQPTGTNKSVWTERYFGGVRYVPLPWLVPSITGDYFNTTLSGDFIWGFRPRLEILIRANVKLRVDLVWQKLVGEQIGFKRMEAMLDVGF